MNRKMTIPIEKAEALAKDLGEEFVATVADLLARGIQAVTVEAMQNADGSYDVGIREPDGVMVALMIPSWLQPEIAIPGGEPASDLHITLAYLGDAASLSLEDQRKLIGTVGEVALRTPALNGVLKGVGRFDGDENDPLWVGVDVPGLEALQRDLAETLTVAGFTLSTHGTYVPHVTVAYLPKDTETPAVDFAPVPVEFCEVTVCVGGQRLGLDLQKTDQYAYPEQEARGWTAAVINKSIETVEEERYTLAPFYLPDTLDAHNEHTDTRNLEKSFWKYMTKASPNIRLQHGTAEIVAGERVDGVVWPIEVTVPLTKADGTQVTHTFPAGTPWLGVKWEPWAWQLILDGKINGYSMGGSAKMLEVDLEGGQEAYDAWKA